MLFLTSFAVTISAEYQNYTIKDLETTQDQIGAWDRETYSLTLVEGTEYKNYNIVAFAVSEKGEIAVCLGERFILLFDEKAELFKAFKFNKRQVSTILSWNDDCLCIIDIKHRTVCTVDKDGIIKSVETIDPDEGNNSRVLSEIEYTKTVGSNGNIYSMKKSIFSLIFTGGIQSDKLIITDRFDKTYCIFQSRPLASLKFFAINFLIPFTAFSLFGFLVIKDVCKRKKN